jgi:hypothetical protein
LTIGIEITIVREVRVNLLVKENDVGEIVQKDVRELLWKKTCDVLLRQRERAIEYYTLVVPVIF